MAQGGHDLGDGVFGGVVVADDFDQGDDVGGGEEVGADEAVAAQDGAGDGVDGQAGGVGGKQGVRGAQGVQLGEEAALEVQVFRDGFDDEVAGGGGFKAGFQADALDGFLDVAGGVDVQLAVDGLQGPLEGAFHRVDQDDVESFRGEQRGDAAAHGACADDGEILEGSVHDGSLGACGGCLQAGTAGDQGELCLVQGCLSVLAWPEKSFCSIYEHLCVYRISGEDSTKSRGGRTNGGFRVFEEWTFGGGWAGVYVGGVGCLGWWAGWRRSGFFRRPAWRRPGARGATIAVRSLRSGLP
ncbi:hypothetical protein D3C71_1357190 [compost metagenome]